MKSLDFKTIQDVIEAQEIWEELSPKKVLDDAWAFRFAFVKDLRFSLHFIVGMDEGKAVGFLPLQIIHTYGLKPPYAVEGEFLEFFGGDDTDNNSVFLKPGYEAYSSQFLSQIDRPAVLAPLSPTFENEAGASVYEYLYRLDLTGFANHEEYLEARWEGESKRTIKKQMRRLYKNHAIEVTYNNPEALEKLFSMNLERFGETSSFRFPYRQQVFRHLRTLFDVQVISVVVDGNIEAVSYGIIYHDTYVGMNAGVNNAIRDLGKLLVFLQMDRALSLGVKTYDGGKGSGEWKEEFKFQKMPQYKLPLLV